MDLLFPFEKIKAFDALCKVVHNCRTCPRMSDSLRVLSRSAGGIGSPIMFVGEAPGRLGADSSGIPFHGDKAGHNFEELLEFAGFTRADIFVTNAVLCNPKDSKGNNAPPSGAEVENCASYLRQQIELVDPKIVVTLGACALRATALISHHSLELRQSVRTSNKWFDRRLIPLYHPGQRAMIHRSFANQRSDYQFVSEVLGRLGVKKRNTGGPQKAEVLTVVKKILTELPQLSYFALHKIFYLIELEHVQRTGRQLTRAYFIRQKDGPYCVDLQLDKLRKGIASLVVNSNKAGGFSLSIGEDLFDITKYENEIDREADEAALKKVIEKCRSLSESSLKTKVYLTRPMKRILREEATNNLNLYNTPIEFADEAMSSSRVSTSFSQ